MFTNKTGQLTDYALSCGYVESYTTKSFRVVLSKEHNTYHVKNTSNQNRVWLCFDKLSEARQAYLEQIKTINEMKVG